MYNARRFGGVGSIPAKFRYENSYFYLSLSHSILNCVSLNFDVVRLSNSLSLSFCLSLSDTFFFILSRISLLVSLSVKCQNLSKLYLLSSMPYAPLLLSPYTHSLSSTQTKHTMHTMAGMQLQLSKIPRHIFTAPAILTRTQ